MAIKSTFCASILLLATAQVNAALISIDYLSAGDGLITRDSGTGLQWLDLTYSTNISFNDMEALLASDSFYDDFRRATEQEVNQLFLNAGVVTLNDRSTDNIAGVQLLTSLLGDTYEYLGTERNGGLGFTGTIVDPGSDLPIRPADYFTTTEFGFLEATAGANGFANADFALPLIGHYLVSAVPIPASVWLFGTGLLGLLGVARRKGRV